MTNLFYGLGLLIGILILIKGSQIAVKRLSNIAAFMQWREFTVAFVLMSFTSSLPELFVGIIAAVNKTPQLSLGNVLGANLINITLVIGIPVLLARGISVKKKISKKESLWILILALLPIFLLLDRRLSRIDGLILFLALIVYLKYILAQKERYEKRVENSKWYFLKYFLGFILGVVLLILGAYLSVGSAVILAKNLHLPLILIGLFVLSFGTVLPELSFRINAIRNGYKEMVLGDLFGTIAVNFLLILGVVALICPIEIKNFIPFSVSAIFLILGLVLFSVFLRTKERLSVKEGLFLIGFYFLFLIVEFLVGGAGY